MASVTSLDADMRNLRMSRYTPQAANEARAWIESSLRTSLPTGDLLEALKDGVVLCQLANLAIQPHHAAIKFKKSAMPFMQMENISHFLRACEMPPLSLPAHDRFLTVDLYEGKDAAQVLQCLGAFSRQAHQINPRDFPTTIGPKKLGNGANAASPAIATTHTGTSVSSANSNPSAPVSSWSKRSDEGATAPAWNIHQYGYMGGASQGNQGINFGVRRQVTSQAPVVPSLAQKEKLRKEKEAEAERQRQREAEETERRRRAAAEAEERAQVDEARRWEEETERLREEERKRLEHQRREWEEQERKWKSEEEKRQREESLIQTPQSGGSILRGQTLAEYQREQAASARGASAAVTESPEQKRVRELEKQLEEARERERQYQAEREERLRKETGEHSRPTTAQTDKSATPEDPSWIGDEREYVRQQWQSSREGTPAEAIPPVESAANSRPLPTAPVISQQGPPTPAQPPSLPARSPQPASTSSRPFFATRPLPTPAKATDAFVPEARQPNRTDQYLETHTAPAVTGPRISASKEAGDTSLEQARDRDARIASQEKTKAGGWAGKSLLEREMERERERQREWESNQQAVRNAPRDATQGTGQGQTWDVNQYGYMGGDNMNRGSGVGSGINIGGRRQIIGPRPKP